MCKVSIDRTEGDENGPNTSINHVVSNTITIESTNEKQPNGNDQDIFNPLNGAHEEEEEEEEEENEENEESRQPQYVRAKSNIQTERNTELQSPQHQHYSIQSEHNINAIQYNDLISPMNSVHPKSYSSNKSPQGRTNKKYKANSRSNRSSRRHSRRNSEDIQTIGAPQDEEDENDINNIQSVNHNNHKSKRDNNNNHSEHVSVPSNLANEMEMAKFIPYGMQNSPKSDTLATSSEETHDEDEKSQLMHTPNGDKSHITPNGKYQRSQAHYKGNTNYDSPSGSKPHKFWIYSARIYIYSYI